MQKLRSFLLALFCATHLVNISKGEGLQCSGSSSDNQQRSLSVNSIRSTQGKWETSFLAQQNTNDQPTVIDVNVTQNYTKCQGSHIIQIRGFLKDMSQEQNVMKLVFKRSSKNAVIANNGRSLQKIKLDGYGSGFTSRTLLDDEIFTVRIDAKDGKFSHALGIGVSLLTLDSQDLQDHSYNYKYEEILLPTAEISKLNTAISPGDNWKKESYRESFLSKGRYGLYALFYS